MVSGAYHQSWSALLEAARAGDDAALGRICHQLRQYLVLTAAGDLGTDLQSKLDASDIVQQAMLEACRDFASFRGGSEEEFRNWLRRLVRNSMIDATRRYRETRRRDLSREIPLDDPRRRVAPIDNDPTASSCFRRRETDEELLRAIASLPEQKRRVIELRHRDRLSYDQIAVELNITIDAARKLWSRTVELLRQQMTAANGQSRSH